MIQLPKEMSKERKQAFFLKALKKAIEMREANKKAGKSGTFYEAPQTPVEAKKIVDPKPTKTKSRFIARVGRGARGQRKQRRGGRGRRWCATGRRSPP